MPVTDNFFTRLGNAWYIFGRGKKGWNQLNNSYRIGNKGPVWIDIAKPIEMYLTIPQLQTVINRFATMFSNMEIKEIDIKSGKDVTSDEFKAFISNPNPLQGMNEFLTEYQIQILVYGNQFMYKNQPSALQSLPSTLFNIPPEYMQPITTGKIWDQAKIDGIISGYKYFENSIDTIFDTNSILYSRKPDPRNPIKGLSPIMSLKYPLSNILAGYQFENVTMSELGGIGIISGANGKDAFGSVPLTQEEKLEMERQHRRNYGIEDEQNKLIISTGNVTFTPMSYPVKDMQPIEARDSHFATIVDHFKLNSNIFSNKSATFENLKQGILLSYQDAIQPAADDFVQKLDRFIGQRKGVKRIASYEHIPILKDAKSLQALSIGQIVTALNDAVAGGLIDKPTASTILTNEISILNG